MTTALQSWQPLSRGDRSVRRVGLRLPAGVSEHRAVFLVEEALRLISLPGEDQGRTYYFRRVALRGISASSPPREWVERAQAAMQALAARAVHGAEARAAASDAVFFNSQQEALEWLLRRLFQSYPGAAGGVEWFAPMISPAAADGDAAMQAAAVIERLRGLPSGWFAAATVLLDLLERSSVAWRVLESIPERALRVWLSELGGAPLSASSDVPRISAARRRILLSLLSRPSVPVFYRGATDSGAFAGTETAPSARQPVWREPTLYFVWLAALAVVAEHPGELARGAPAADARALLRQLAESLNSVSSEETRHAKLPALLHTTEAMHTGPRQGIAPAEEAMVDRSQDGIQDSSNPALDVELAADRSLFTSAGGLYFLLNVLRDLGIEGTIEGLPSPLRSVFLARLIDALGRAASVPRDDAALLWVTGALDASGQDVVFDVMIAAPACWPQTLFAPPDRELTLSRLIRVWMLAIRRWCWRSARLTLREIVSRPARILLMRTDLDVTLPMDTVDLRIRKIGLDIDPGWLPWFGRVVRFHYVRELQQCDDGGEAR